MLDITRKREDPEPLLVDVRVAARLLSVCERTVWNMAKRGELPSLRIGRAVRFSVDDIKAWIQRQTTRNT